MELFSEVKDKNVTPPKWEEHPFKDEHFRTCACIVPVKDARNLSLVFPAIDLQQYYKAAVSRNKTLCNGYVFLLNLWTIW